MQNPVTVVRMKCKIGTVEGLSQTRRAIDLKTVVAAAGCDKVRRTFALDSTAGSLRNPSQPSFLVSDYSQAHMHKQKKAPRPNECGAKNWLVAAN